MAGEAQAAQLGRGKAPAGGLARGAQDGIDGPPSNPPARGNQKTNEKGASKEQRVEAHTENRSLCPDPASPGEA